MTLALYATLVSFCASITMLAVDAFSEKALVRSLSRAFLALCVTLLFVALLLVNALEPKSFSGGLLVLEHSNQLASLE